MGNPWQYIYTMTVMELLLPYHTSQLITPLEKKLLGDSVWIGDQGIIWLSSLTQKLCGTIFKHCSPIYILSLEPVTDIDVSM